MNRRTLWNSTAKTKRSQYTERDKVTKTMGQKTGKADIKTTSRQTDRQTDRDSQRDSHSNRPVGDRDSSPNKDSDRDMTD